MARSLRRGLVMLALVALAAPAAAQTDADVQRLQDEVRKRDDRIDELERKFDVLASELSKVRTQVAVPEEPELKSAYGLGPAASKIYGVERGLSLGGYGEFFYRHFIDDEEFGSETLPGGTSSDRQLDRADFLRLVTYLGYKFSDRIVFNSEIEFEHAFIGEETTSAGSGEVTVEFAALDFFLRDWANARAGLLLLPMGFLNEVHEPPFFHGVSRPETETRILPSTWRENGAGFFGRIGEDLEYRAYLVAGFNAAGFSDGGIRGGRQQANRALAEDFAVVGRLDWTPLDGLLIGASAYRGNSGQDQTFDATGLSLPNATLTIFEGHAQYRREQLELRGLFAMSLLSDATELNVALGRAANRPVAEEMLGGYAEVAYDVWPWLFGEAGKYLAPFLRVEYVDTQFEVPSGYTRNERNRYWLVTPGLAFKPHPNVALKLEYRNFEAMGGTERPDEISFGMGFAF